LKKKKTKIQKLRSKCDSYLTPIIKKQYPSCFFCGGPTQVAHHFIHKSKSNSLRYDLDNLINLCGRCHCALHNNESYYTGKIIEAKGMDWFQKLVKKNKIIKANTKWYEDNLNRLKKELDKEEPLF
jgi:5-methylcytosine-specific restriction endonuclease McrA